MNTNPAESQGVSINVACKDHRLKTTKISYPIGNHTMSHMLCNQCRQTFSRKGLESVIADEVSIDFKRPKRISIHRLEETICHLKEKKNQLSKITNLLQNENGGDFFKSINKIIDKDLPDCIMMNEIDRHVIHVHEEHARLMKERIHKLKEK